MKKIIVKRFNEGLLHKPVEVQLEEFLAKNENYDLIQMSSAFNTVSMTLTTIAVFKERS